MRVPTLKISGLSNFGTKCHLDVGFIERHRVYYKGEGANFPQVRTVVNLVSPSLPWFVLAPKCSNYALTNLLFSLCKFMRVIKCLSFFLVPS
jgi:hypothetical protein